MLTFHRQLLLSITLPSPLLFLLHKHNIVWPSDYSRLGEVRNMSCKALDIHLTDACQ